MIQFQLFPRSKGVSDEIRAIVECFELEADKIRSPENNLSSNEVLAIVRAHLEKIGFVVETGKSASNKINVPVLFGFNNRIDKSFNADAISKNGKIVI